MTLRLKANMRQWKAISKALIFTGVLVVPLCLAVSVSAASDARQKAEMGYNRLIDVNIGQTKWRAAGAGIKSTPRSERKVLELLTNEGIEYLEQYAKWLRENVRYRNDDGSDTWSLPEETLARRCGDCEDLAFLNRQFLRALGYEPQVAAFRKAGWEKWHAICVFEKEDRYFYFDNCRLKSTPAATMEQFARHIGAGNDMVVFGSDAITEVLQKTINLKDVARGTKVQKKNGSIFITAGRN